MSVFGYDYLVDHLGKAKADTLALLKFQGLRAEGESYALEALNFVDGKRSVQSIRDALAAEFGPVPLEPVVAVPGGAGDDWRAAPVARPSDPSPGTAGRRNS